MTSGEFVFPMLAEAFPLIRGILTSVLYTTVASDMETTKMVSCLRVIMYHSGVIILQLSSGLELLA